MKQPKIYRHKGTGVRVEFIESNSQECQYKPVGNPVIGRNASFPVWAIENSEDWVEMVEMPISNHYSKEEVKKIFDRAERDLYLTNENVGFRVSGIALNAITALKNTFFFYLNR